MVAHSEQQLTAVQSLKIPNPALSDVIVVVADDQPRGPWAGTVYDYLTGKRVRSWQALSLTPNPHRVLRIANNTFELEPAQEGGFSMHLYRNTQRYPMRVGDRIVTQAATIEVLAVDQGTPLRIRVSTERSLDDPSLFFAARYRGQLVRIRPPPIGGAVILL
jgi:hypothetical protein